MCLILSDRVNGAPAPGGFSKSYTSDPLEDMFFNDENYVKDYLHASEEKRKKLPGANFFKQVTFSSESRFEVGEKYIEFVKFSCTKSQTECSFCSRHDWVGPLCERAPKPYPDYGADGFHYLSVFKTPTHLEREVDDFQPRKHTIEQHAEGIADDDSITEFSKKYIVEEVILRNYLQHLEYLDINKRKRAEVRQLKMQQANNRTFEEYDLL